ncbi:MAG: serine hydrolase [Cyclobacteriaceae bacterium]|nr:serine hydrolase [Cyclobacteriaceae bacterium]
MKFLAIPVLVFCCACGQASGASRDTLSAIDSYLRKLEAEHHFSGGLLIVDHGRKVFSKGYGWADRQRQIRFTPRTLASIGSITKSFTAVAIMKLAEQGKLAVTDPISKYFSDVPADKAGITIHQLLTHSGGFHEFLKADGGDYEAVDQAAFLRRAWSEPLLFAPGARAQYTNVGFSLLGMIIEKVAGQSYESYLKELFGPTGVRAIGYRYPAIPGDTIAVGYRNGERWGTHQEHFAAAGGGPYWNLKANGGLEASLGDMFRWITAIDNGAVLNQGSLASLFKPHIQEEANQQQEIWFGYGCNISRSSRGYRVIGNGGSNGIYFARLLRFPDQGLAFYMVTNEQSMNTNMVLPNVLQLYFDGAITKDAVAQRPRFENPQSEVVASLLDKPGVSDLGAALQEAGVVVDDDMVLLEVGQQLMEKGQYERARLLYEYYTRQFPRIVVSWNDLADVYLALKDPVRARTCFEQALRIRPENPRAKEGLRKLDEKK